MEHIFLKEVLARSVICLTMATAFAGAGVARGASFLVTNFDDVNNVGFGSANANSSVTTGFTDRGNPANQQLTITTNAYGGFTPLAVSFIGRGDATTAALTQGTALNFDVSWYDDEINNSVAPEGDFLLLRWVINTDAWGNGGGNYRDFSNIFIGDGGNSSGTLSLDLTGNPQIQTAAQNYINGQGSYFSLTLDNNGYPSQTAAGNQIHLDNLRVEGVPEPTSLATLSVLAASALCRKRANSRNCNRE